MNKWLADWTKRAYPDSKRDLCTCFIERGQNLTIDRGYEALITSDTCMYISSFEQLRKNILSRSTIVCFIDTRGTNAHPDVFDANAGWVLYNAFVEGVKGSYFKLNQAIAAKEAGLLEALADPDCGWLYCRAALDFADIPGAPIAYWLPAGSGKAFLERRCADIFQSAGRTKTHNNEVYLRKWWEISTAKLGAKWRRYCNGGGFSKWAGLDYDVVNWSTEAIAEYGSHGGLPNMDLCDKSGLCWGLITSSKTSFRVKPANYLYSSGSPTLIASNPEETISAMAFLNSSLCEAYLDALNPTLNTTVNDVLALPCPDTDAGVLASARQCINLVEDDWDSFEASSSFRRHPLL